MTTREHRSLEERGILDEVVSTETPGLGEARCERCDVLVNPIGIGKSVGTIPQGMQEVRICMKCATPEEVKKAERYLRRGMEERRQTGGNTNRIASDLIHLQSERKRFHK